MTKTISVTSNISNRVKKIRDGAVYQEWTCFVAELIQNAQRARAKNIWIETSPALFAISDDGIGCNDPKKVFTLDFSGWGSDVHSPFGEGFSSTFIVADQITVQSQTWIAFFDLKEALQTRNFDSVQLSKSDYWKGFQVVLHLNEQFRSATEKIEEIEEEVKKIGAMIAPNVYLNGDLITKRTICYEPFAISKRLRDFGEIIVAPAENWEPIEVLYEGRPVTNLYIKGIKGLLALRDGAVTLRAPDRRDIVHDMKRYKLTNRLEQLAKEVLYTLVTDYPDQIPSFKHAIMEKLSPAQYARKITYGLRKKQKQKNRLQDKTEYRVADLMPAADPEDFTQEIYDRAPIGILAGTATKKSQACEDSQEEITEIRRLARRSRIFYRLHDEDEYKKLQAQVEYFGLTVLVVDELAAKALEWMGVPHLKEAGHNVYQRFRQSNVGPRTKKEERILKLLEPVAKHYGISPRVFDFADIECIVETQIGGKVVHRKKMQVNGICIKQNGVGKILLSRKELKIRQFEITHNAKLGTAKDLKILMNVVPTVAHELCHYLYDSQDNTLEMAKQEKRVAREIFELLSQIF